MAAMARRKISNRGRILAAGLCVGATGLLAGLMAATDDTGNASAGTSSRTTDPASQPVTGTNGSSSYDRGFDDDRGFSDGSGSSGTGAYGTTQQPSFPQPNTRSGGS